MNLPLSTAFTVSHRFWVVLFSFSFVSMHILISFLISSVIYWLFSSVLFSLHLLEFLIVFLLLVFSVTQSCPTLCDPMNYSMPGLSVHHQLPEFTQTHVHWVGDAIQPSHPLSSPSPPTLNPSQHQSLFQWVNSAHEVAKGWSFSFSIIPSKEHPGLISFRMDWLDLLAVQGTPKSLLQHHSSKASILCSAFFIVQFSHPYMTTGKTIALTRWTFFWHSNVSAF